MKLLVVGHSYLTAYAQNKYAAIKKLEPSLQLRIIVPDAMDHTLMRYAPELASGLEREEVISIKRLVGGSHSTYVLNPFSLIKVLLSFRPDYIHIEEDPHSFIGLETVLLVRIFARKAALSFFIWDNLARVPAFPLNIIKKWLTQFSLHNATGVIAGNQEARSLLISRKGYKGKTAVLPQLGIDASRYDLQTENKIKSHNASFPPVIGFVARLIPEKGIFNLLPALRELLDLSWQLHLIGAGPLQSQIVSEWKPLFGDRLTLFGSIPHTEVANHLKSMDILVLPSLTTPHWKEQFGHVLLEAMASGVAIIGSDSGAIPEVLGDAAIIFPEKRIEKLQEALRILLTTPEKRIDLARKGQARARAYYTHEVIAHSYLQTFNVFQHVGS